MVLDATDRRAVAEFWCELLGYVYWPGYERPSAGQPDPTGADWLVLMDRAGYPRIAVQSVAKLPVSTWPDPLVPQQLHLDLTLPDRAELSVQRDRALSLGAKLLQDRSTDPDEPLYVLADPAGHPFCIFVPLAIPANRRSGACGQRDCYRRYVTGQAAMRSARSPNRFAVKPHGSCT